LQFIKSVPRYLLTRGLGGISPQVYWTRWSCLRYGEVPEPTLPGPDWVRVKTIYGGICGSDLHLVTLEQSPSMSPYASFPFVIGHENVGTVVEVGGEVADVQLGQRVVVNPLLSCVPRGIQPLCPRCQAGDPGLCENFTAGRLAAGMSIGSCRDTGGSWGEFFVAHRSQLYPVPEGVTDEQALLTEPLACALRAVLRHPPRPGQTCLVVGAGVIGLLVVAVLRAQGHSGPILVLARHQHQASLARRFGADQVIRSGRGSLQKVARALGARTLETMIGPPVLSGGAEVVYECSGSSSGLDTALRCAGRGGQVVLLGLATFPRGLDWSFIWRNELQLRGVFWYGLEPWQGRRVPAFHLALQLMAEGKVDPAPLLTHTFALEDYPRALDAATHKATSGVVKAAFSFR